MTIIPSPARVRSLPIAYRGLAAVLVLLWLTPLIPHGHECEHAVGGGVELSTIEHTAEGCSVCGWLGQATHGLIVIAAVAAVIVAVGVSFAAVSSGIGSAIPVPLRARPPPR